MSYFQDLYDRASRIEAKQKVKKDILNGRLNSNTLLKLARQERSYNDIYDTQSGQDFLDTLEQFKAILGNEVADVTLKKYLFNKHIQSSADLNEVFGRTSVYIKSFDFSDESHGFKTFMVENRDTVKQIAKKTIAQAEQRKILLDLMDENQQINFETQLLNEKTNRLTGHSDIKSMAKYAANCPLEDSSRVVVGSCLIELHDMLQESSSKKIAMAAGTGAFLKAIGKVSNIHKLVSELIRNQNQDKAKNKMVADKIRLVRSQGDMKRLIDIIAGVLQFDLSGQLSSLKDMSKNGNDILVKKTK